MLKTRILTALVMIPLVLLALFLLPAWAWRLAVVAVVAVAAWEWGRLGTMPAVALASYVALSAMLLAVGIWLAPPSFWRWVDPIACVFWILIMPCWLAIRWRVSKRALFALIGWVVLLPAGWAMVRWRELYGPLLLLLLMMVVWIADSAAYFSGKAFGKHKLAPAISPGKSWEGVVGAVLVSMGYLLAIAAAGWVQGLHLSTPHLLLAGWLLVALSVAGDLFESLLKRQAGVKDSSQLLPGHGGVLDRVDALLPVLAVAMAVLALLRP